jgi:hypothetical protein
MTWHDMTCRQANSLRNKQKLWSDWAKTNLEMPMHGRWHSPQAFFTTVRIWLDLSSCIPATKTTEISSHCRNPKSGEVKKDFHLYLRILYLVFNKASYNGTMQEFDLCHIACDNAVTFFNVYFLKHITYTECVFLPRTSIYVLEPTLQHLCLSNWELPLFYWE